MIQQRIKMRAFFAQEVHKVMEKNKKIWVVSTDFGYKMWDNVQKDFPDRYINTGASEQAATGIAIGLALNGKIPFLYNATSFLLYRPFETIRNYIHNEKIPVILVGSGRDKNYLEDGFSHWAEEDKKVMKIFSNITPAWPKNIKEIPQLIQKMIKSQKPWYINLIR